MPEREVRYCTTEDGVRIAYCLEGNGPALVVFPWGLASFALTHLVPAYEQFPATIGKGRQLVFWDSRGVGMSERSPHDLSPAALLRDLDAVVSAVGLERFSVFAMTDATPHAFNTPHANGGSPDSFCMRLIPARTTWPPARSARHWPAWHEQTGSSLYGPSWTELFAAPRR